MFFEIFCVKMLLRLVGAGCAVLLAYLLWANKKGKNNG